MAGNSEQNGVSVLGYDVNIDVNIKDEDVAMDCLMCKKLTQAIIVVLFILVYVYVVILLFRGCLFGCA